MSNPFPRPIAADAAFSLASITNDSMERDWSEFYNADTGEPGFQSVLPAITLGVIDERAADLWDDFPKARALFEVDGAAVLADEELEDAFRQTEGYDEWRDSFDPMMNYGWPVDLKYVDSEGIAAIAARFDAWGLACTLIEIDNGRHDEPDYEIALTGGGMNLTDHLAAAYIACGHVPPITLLDNLSGSFPSGLVHRLPMVEVIERAADWLRHKADRMDELAVKIDAGHAKE
ncbi:hypothetical protein MARCHEWKA_01420 [Brevundimonas phage vB_BpoS-Marchewka]|uniref:Uncharacterized protein n=1 Tax=Brevundimonas phage vB_BpoS-Marchewka TaxID=2948604 RepID=A0A9E7ST32_9CAUD|nr:hypothetical protein MARCHEWKA_01420 [Brevundimonas phage vB_BpoS-Marchewka]